MFADRGQFSSGLIAIVSFEFIESLHQPIEIVGASRVNEVDIERRNGRSIENCRNPSDDDEVNAMARQHLECIPKFNGSGHYAARRRC